MQRFINDRYHEVIKNDYAGLVKRVRTSIDETGLAVVEDFIHPDFLTELRANVTELTPLCYQGGKRKYLIGGDLEKTAAWEVAFSDFTIQLANDILSPFHVHLEASDIHPVMNILVGEKGQDSVRGWHFDATYLTMAMPVVMPEPTGDRDGKFRIWPNVRPFSQSKLSDRFYSNVARVQLFQRFVNHLSINFVPGNLYFFYGFRSYHGTEDLDASKLRANCLINFGGPLFDLQKGKQIQYTK
jgi:hypothetical protein